MNELFGGPILPTLLKLALASIIVGLLLAFFGIRPMDLWTDFLDTVAHIWQMGFSAVDWSIRYFLLGAVVVVPIWLAIRLWDILMQSRKK